MNSVIVIRGRWRKTHRIIDHTLPIALRLQTASLNECGKFVGNRNRDLHAESVAGLWKLFHGNCGVQQAGEKAA